MFRYLVYLLLCILIVKSELDSGEFDLIVSDYINCKGPKRKSCAESTQTITGNSTVTYNLNVTETMRTLKAKITSTMNEQELLRLFWKDVCQNMFMKVLLQTLFQLSNDCGIVKGSYKFTVDIQSLARKFYGGKFMYGNWTSRVLLYTNDCNMHCGVIYLTMNPRHSNNK